MGLSRAERAALRDAEKSGAGAGSVQIKRIGADQLYNERWAKDNVSYVAGLVDREERKEMLEAGGAGVQDLQKVDVSETGGGGGDAGSTTVVTGKQKQKHQIHFLAAQAQVKQQEMANALGGQALSRNDNRAKYGW